MPKVRQSPQFESRRRVFNRINFIGQTVAFELPAALVVEDNEIERELLAGVLRMSGFEVVAVRDGLAAIEQLKTNEQNQTLF